MRRKSRKERLKCPSCRSRGVRRRKNYPFGKTKTRIIMRRKLGERANIISEEKVRARPRVTYICKNCGRVW